MFLDMLLLSPSHVHKIANARDLVSFSSTDSASFIVQSPSIFCAFHVQAQKPPLILYLVSALTGTHIDEPTSVRLCECHLTTVGSRVGEINS